ncbi:hypothetical protein PCE1_000157 [Barthelona sp. PCE]
MGKKNGGGKPKKMNSKDQKKQVEERLLAQFGKKKNSRKARMAREQITREVAAKSRGMTSGSLDLEAEKARKRAEKERQKRERAFARINELIEQPKVPEGQDAQDFLCAYIAKGKTCPQGSKCHYSHDVEKFRAAKKEKSSSHVKVNLSVDIRTQRMEELKAQLNNAEKTSSQHWDRDTLEQVIEQQYSRRNQYLRSKKVCPCFLDAVKKNQFGWFWECVRGNDCPYLHAFPPGYDMPGQKKQEEKVEIPLEEIIEAEREKIVDGTPMTQEVFSQWKEQRVAEKRARTEREVKKEVKKAKRGKEYKISGRLQWFLQISDRSIGSTGVSKEELEENLKAEMAAQEQLVAPAVAPVVEPVVESVAEDSKAEAE